MLDSDRGPAYQIRRLIISSGAERAFCSEEWADALVVVEKGTLELESLKGERIRFVAGDILCLARVPVRMLRNPGAHPVVVSATSRRVTRPA
jgi:quercetin dioxygenase-like cupin family protein